MDTQTNENILDMHLQGGHLSVYISFWDKNKQKLRKGIFTFDTGASVTTISKDILFNLGYDVINGPVERISTASGMEYVRSVTLDKVQFGGIQLQDVNVYAHTFPEESLTSGVIGINILSNFDINMLFSQKQIVLKKIP